MDDLIWVLAFGVAAAVLIAPVIALFSIFSLRKRLRAQEAVLQDHHVRAERAEWWIGELVRRVDALASEAQSAKDNAAAAAQDRAPVAEEERTASTARITRVPSVPSAPLDAAIPANLTADPESIPTLAARRLVPVSPESSPTIVARRISDPSASKSTPPGPTHPESSPTAIWRRSADGIDSAMAPLAPGELPTGAVLPPRPEAGSVDAPTIVDAPSTVAAASAGAASAVEGAPAVASRADAPPVHAASAVDASSPTGTASMPRSVPGSSEDASRRGPPEGPGSRRFPPGPPPPTSGPVAKPFDFEKLVGVRLFAWLGGIGLFIGAAFFLEYSIEHELISPPLRIGLGLLLGAGAVLVGDVIRTKGDRAGQALGGAGIATLYASLYAARTLYELIPAAAAFVGMICVTAVAVIIAARRNAFVLSVIGLVGGFATPVLLSSGEDHRFALFAYIALLDAAVLYVASRRKWIALTAMALVATTIIYVGWASEYLDPDGVPFALGVAAGLALLFAIGTLAGAIGTGSTQRPNRVRSVLLGIALGAPFVAALVSAGETNLRASPALLCGYLCLLLGATFFTAKRFSAPFSLEIASAFTVLTLVARIGPDVVGADLLMTLVWMTTPSLLLSTLFYWQGARADQRLRGALLRATGIALGGSWLIATQVIPNTLREGSLAPVAVYVALHAAGLVAIGLSRSSFIWPALAQGLWLLFLVTAAQRFEEERLNEFAVLVLGPMLAFFALPLVTPRARAQTAGYITGAVALVTHFAALYLFARNAWPDVALGAGSIVSSVLALYMLTYARPRLPDTGKPSPVLAALGGITLLFITAAVPITLSKQWITVAWALEATALAWLFLRLPHRGVLVASALLSASTLTRLLANPLLWEYHQRSGIVVFNWYLYTFGIPALCLFGAAYLLKGDETAHRYRYPLCLWFAGGIVSFVLLNVEIADAYSTGETIGFHMGASLGEDMTYSLGWGVFGLITLIVGLLVRNSKVRVSALGVLLLTIGKVFLHDLWHLGALYRVGSMMGLALALLAVSFLTQRYILRGDRS